MGHVSQYELPIAEDQEGTLSILEMLQESAIRPRKEFHSSSTSVPEDQEAPLSILEMLQESAIAIEPKKEPLTSRISLRTPFLSSLRKTSDFLRTHSVGFKRESQPKSPQVESFVFENHIALPVTVPRTPREAAPGLRKKASVSTSVFTQSTRSQTQQYPPDTPDRPAPLNVKSSTAPTLSFASPRAVSTPSKSRYVLPLPPDGLSPVPPMPRIPPPSRYVLQSPPKYSLFPPQYQRQPRSAVSEKLSMVEDDTSTAHNACCTTPRSNIIDDTVAEVDDLLESYSKYALSPRQLVNSETSSVYSNTHEPKLYNAISSNGVSESRHDTPVTKDGVASTSPHAPNSINDSAEWETVQDSASDSECSNRGLSLYDSRGFLVTHFESHEEGDAVDSSSDESPGIRVQPALQSPHPLRSDSLPVVSKTPTRRVTPAQRTAARQASKEAREANLAAMSRSSSFQVSTARRVVPLAPPLPPCDLEGGDGESDDEAAEEGESLIFGLGPIRGRCGTCGQEWKEAELAV